MQRRADEIPVEALLAHASFLRGLARGLLVDRDAAEDVVQETWLAAVERPPRRGLNPRAWLAGVARNLARQSARRTQRRARREAIGSTEATVERLDIFRAVVDAVRELREPYRSTILHRYFDELSPVEIARRENVPLETVRTRLRRGLALLRASLDRGHGGNRSTWCGALAPFVVSLKVAESTAASGSAAAGIGAMIMSTKTVVGAMVVIAAAICALLVVVLQGPGDSDGDHDTRRTASPIDATVAVPLDAADAARSEADPARGAEPAAGAWVVRGKAVLPDGEPFPGAKIVATAYDGVYSDMARVLETEIESDAKGIFVWPLELPERISTLRMCGREPEFETETARFMILPRDPPPEPFELTFRPADHRVVGRVTDAAGHPLPGAMIWNSYYSDSRRRVSCDDEGRYVFAVAPPPNSRIRIHATAPGFGERRQVLRLLAMSEARLDFRLEPEVHVHGRVLDEEGAPIAGARVGEFITDESGRYEVRNIDPRSRHPGFTVRCNGYVGQHMSLSRMGVTTTMDVILKRGVRLEGTFLDQHRTPIVRTKVVIIHKETYGQQSTLTNRDGCFAFPAVLSGEHEIQATSPAGNVLRTIEVPQPGGPAHVIELQIEPVEGGHFLEGTVTDQVGNPLAGANLTFLTAKSNLIPHSLDVRGETGVDGSFRVDGLPGDGVIVGVNLPGYVRHSEMLDRLDQSGVRFRLHRAVRLSGRVVDDSTGEPVKIFRIRFVTPKVEPGDEIGHGYDVDWSGGTLVQSIDGTWSTGSIFKPGVILGVEASAPGHAPETVYRVPVPADPDSGTLVIRLRGTGTLVGRVVLFDTNQPVPDARVRLFDQENRLDTAKPVYDWHHGEVVTTTTDAAGHFRIEDIPEGEHSLAVFHDELGLAVDGPFLVIAGDGGPERTVRFRPAGRIEGMLLDYDEQPVAFGKVSAVTSDNRGVTIRETNSTDAEGRFAFEGLPSGTYSVARVTERGSHMYNANLLLREGETCDVVVTPIDGTASIHVTLEYDGEWPSKLTVSMWESEAYRIPREEQRMTRHLRITEKEFHIEGIAAGRYQLNVGAFGRRIRGSTIFSLAEGETLELTVRIE